MSTDIISAFKGVIDGDDALSGVYWEQLTMRTIFAPSGECGPEPTAILYLSSGVDEQGCLALLPLAFSYWDSNKGVRDFLDGDLYLHKSCGVGANSISYCIALEHPRTIPITKRWVELIDFMRADVKEILNDWHNANVTGIISSGIPNRNVEISIILQDDDRYQELVEVFCDTVLQYLDSDIPLTRAEWIGNESIAGMRHLFRKFFVSNAWIETVIGKA